MRDFFGYLLVVVGVGAMMFTLCAGLFIGGGTSAMPGGFGLFAVVFGAAILDET